MKNSRLWPYILVFVSGGIWGITFSLARLATEAGAQPLGMAWWQGLGGGLFLIMVCAWRKRWPVLNKQHLKFYALLGTLGTAFPSIFYFYAASRVPAGIIAITTASVPLVTYGASWLLGVDKYSPRRIAGVAAGLLAIAVLVGPETSLPERSMAIWILIVFAASLAYTIENLYVALRVPDSTDMVSLLCGMLLAAAVLLTPIMLLTDTFVPLRFPWTAIEWSIVGIAVVGASAYSLFLYAIKVAGPVFASQTGYTATISGVLWAMAIFGEQHSLWVWLSLALMMTGLALVTPIRVEQQAT